MQLWMRRFHPRPGVFGKTISEMSWIGSFSNSVVLSSFVEAKSQYVGFDSEADWRPRCDGCVMGCVTAHVLTRPSSPSCVATVCGLCDPGRWRVPPHVQPGGVHHAGEPTSTCSVLNVCARSPSRCGCTLCSERSHGDACHLNEKMFCCCTTKLKKY